MSDNVCYAGQPYRAKSGKAAKADRDQRRAALKIAILQSGLPQMEIARRLGIHFTKLSMLVNGWREPSEAERVGLAKLLAVDADALWPRRAA